MVLVQSARPSSFDRHPNPSRITGMSLAIAIHAAGLLALTILMKPPLVLPTVEKITSFVNLPEKTEPTPPPPIDTKVERVPVIEDPPSQPPERPTQVTTETTQQPIAVGPPVADPVDTLSLPPTSGQPEVSPPVSEPIAGVRLEYASAPAPSYTAALIREQAQGTVLLEILVDVDGKPLKVTIHQSSGNKRLDKLAEQHVRKHWTFRPAMKDGRAIQAIGIVPIDFKLQ